MNQSFIDTQTLCESLLSKLRQYSLSKGSLDKSYYLAVIRIDEMKVRAYTDTRFRDKLSKWLEDKSTLSLKDLIPSDELKDFNAMTLLDTVINYKFQS